VYRPRMVTDPHTAPARALGHSDVAAAGSPFSPELRVLVRPFGTFAELAHGAERAGAAALVLRRPLLMLLCIGAFVSFTSAGRLVLAHVGWSVVFWSFLPAIHVGILLATLALLGRGGRRPLRLARALDLYFVARAPWLLLMIGLVVALLFFVTGRVSLFGLFLRGPFPFVLLGVTLWSGFLDFAFFRAAVGWSRLRALAATVLGYVGFAVPLVVWYYLTGQLVPLFHVPVTP
jgi:hypothetical protein